MKASFKLSDGREVKFGALQWDAVICKFEDWLRNRELTAKIDGWEMLVKRGLMTPDEVARRCDHFNEEASESGRFSFAGPVMGPIMGMVERSETSGDAIQPTYMAARMQMASLMSGIAVDDLIPVAAKYTKEFWAAVQEAFQEVSAESEAAASETGVGPNVGANMGAGRVATAT